LDGKPGPLFYRPVLDVPSPSEILVLHTAVDPHSVIPGVRDQIRKVDNAIAVNRVQTVDELIGTSTSDRQFSTLLLTVFAALALLLAAIGLFGLVSYSVSQRTGEIGIRMALGASRGSVNRMVLLDGLKPALAGLALGIVAAVFATRILRNQLFGVTAGDPLTFMAVPLVLLLVAAVACYLPAVRATQLDPTAALRAD
jgi:putative ABC transport system permease protein